jgi:hypothetical protein
MQDTTSNTKANVSFVKPVSGMFVHTTVEFLFNHYAMQVSPDKPTFCTML